MPDDARLAERVGWSVAALLVVFWGLRLWVGSTSVVWANPLALAFVLAGLALGVSVFATARPPGRRLQAAIMLLLAAAVCCWGYLQVLQAPAYGTDELAFDQYAAELVRQGVDPYTRSLLPSLQQFLVPPIYHTYLLDGHEVSRLSYPALSFLAYVPALVLGLKMQAAVFTDLAAWAAAFLLLWRLLPAGVGWAAGLLLGLLTYANFVVGGVTDALFLPFLLVALWRWDRYGDRAEPGAARWLSPLALGLALSVKQTPWFLLPFLLVALAHEGRRRGPRAWITVPLRYLTTALAVFAGINLSYLVDAPTSWLHSVALPLTSPTVAGGQGFVNLALFERIGGDLHAYTVAAALALLTALAALALFYPTLKRAWVPLVALVFFWPTRSFASYLIDLAPAALLAATTVGSVPRRGSARLRRIRPLLLAVPALAFVIALVLATTTPPPLRLEIVGLHTTGQLRTIDGIDVQVRNRSGRPLRPHFTVANGGYLTSFWYPFGPAATMTPLIPAHTTRRLFLRAPNSESMPSLGGGFALEAFTDDPATISASATIPPPRHHLVLVPDAVNRPVPTGRPIAVTVRVVDRLGNPVHRGGVPISLGQVVYGQHALLPGEASIDDAPEGQTPITKLSDENGRARFTIVGVESQPEPVFFQAWIAPAHDAPTGFSNLLSIQFERSD